jgi:hypothetical protein
MLGPISQELVLKLAPEGRGICRCCRRIGPFNGALSIWWSGVPMLVLCPECFTTGRGVALMRTAEGVDIGVQGEPRLIVPASLMPTSFEINQERANRTRSLGWRPKSSSEAE